MARVELEAERLAQPPLRLVEHVPRGVLHPATHGALDVQVAMDVGLGPFHLVCRWARFPGLAGSVGGQVIDRRASAEVDVRQDSRVGQ